MHRDTSAALVDDIADGFEQRFATVGGQKRFAFLFRLAQLKRPETRERRIAEYVALLAEGRTLT